MSEPQKKSEPVQHPLVVVINNEERVHTIHVPGPDGKATEELLVLLPGVNLVKAELLKACRGNKQFADKFTTKIPRHVALEARSEREGKPILVQGKAVPERVPLAVLTDDEARELIEEATTTEVLLQFRDGESRGELRALIDDRIRLLETGNAETEAA